MVSPIYSFLKFKMSVAPIYKGTCLAYDETNVRYSYLSRGTVQFLDNCIGVEGNIVSGGSFWNVYPNIRYDKMGKCLERFIAVHEDGELCCFVSKFDINMVFIDVDGEYNAPSNTSLLVVDGSLMFQNNQINKYNMIGERVDGFTVIGRAKAVEITYRE